MSTASMFCLGQYSFGLATAAPTEFSASASYNWAEVEKLGTVPDLQFTGKGSETLSLRGCIYPHFFGGLGQVDAMKAEADKGEPLTLVDGTGRNLGQWVIKSVTNTHSYFFKDGVPRRIDFSLSLAKYSDKKA